jgi:hypothetical protein
VTSPVDDLREAAKLLRERAKKAATGPWRHDPDLYWNRPGPFFDQTFVGSGPDETPWCIACTGPSAETWAHGNAAYIASMHPLVGLALADAFEDTAQAIAELEQDGGAIDIREDDVLVRLARLYLGRAEE